jgi:hypothetical protein
MVSGLFGGFILKTEFNILIKLFHDGSNIDILLVHGIFIKSIIFLLFFFYLEYRIFNLPSTYQNKFTYHKHNFPCIEH